MPFKSHAQRRHFQNLVKTGKMKQEMFDEWNKDTLPDDKLPERLHPQKKKKK